MNVALRRLLNLSHKPTIQNITISHFCSRGGKNIISDIVESAMAEQTMSEPTNAATKFIMKTPKGMRDIDPSQAWVRKHVFNTITDCFERHGAQPIDTPVCELKELLVGKYGEESKLIYELEDQGGESLALRYDLTVPFARYLAQNKIQTMTRYHIAKVYRRDNPSITKGRFREFYQCDIDFAGNFESMMPDAECLEILCEILNSVNIPSDFKIKINHRKILDGMFELVGVPSYKFKTICSSIDKLDKMTWDKVKEEMCKEKGLDDSIADKIRCYVDKNGDASLIEELLNSELGKNPEAKQGLEDLKVLYSYAKHMKIDQHLLFDLSLARGLDYYTGLIFEAVLTSKDTEVGSIAAGGRYDNLVSSLVDSNFHVPCVGLSIGIERLFAILESSRKESGDIADVKVHCYVGSIGKGTYVHRLKILRNLRENGIRVKNLFKESCKPLVIYQSCEKENVPYSIFFGAKEIEKNVVLLRSMKDRSEESIEIDSLAFELKKRLGISVDNHV